MIAKILHKGLGVPKLLPGYLNGARSLLARKIPIVMYHGVVTRPPSLFNWCHLDAMQFELQLRFLAGHYRVRPLGEIVDALGKGRSLPRGTAAITFDDGYRSVLTTALPLLERHRLPFTVFLVTQHVGNPELIWQDQLFHALEDTGESRLAYQGHEWSLENPQEKTEAHRRLGSMLKGMSREAKTHELEMITKKLGLPPEIDRDHCLALMDWEEIHTLAKSGLASMGSHSHTHQILSQCSSETQREELRRSRDILMDRLGNADLFAYPNGTRDDFTDVTKSLLRELGYRCGLATTPGLNSSQADLYELRRVNVGADTSFTDFQLRMLGW